MKTASTVAATEVDMLLFGTVISALLRMLWQEEETGHMTTRHRNIFKVLCVADILENTLTCELSGF